MQCLNDFLYNECCILLYFSNLGLRNIYKDKTNRRVLGSVHVVVEKSLWLLRPSVGAVTDCAGLYVG